MMRLFVLTPASGPQRPMGCLDLQGQSGGALRLSHQYVYRRSIAKSYCRMEPLLSQLGRNVINTGGTDKNA